MAYHSRLAIKALLIIAAILATTAARGQRTTRPSLKVDIAATQSVVADTIASPEISISGYEKTLRSTKECLLATNQCADTISAIGITIDYLDMQGRQLHRRAIELTPSDPMAPGQTRQFQFKSWDSQRVWYYRLSEPRRPKGQATPYDVKVTVDYAIKPTAPTK